MGGKSNDSQSAWRHVLLVFQFSIASDEDSNPVSLSGVQQLTILQAAPATVSYRRNFVTR